MRICNFIHALHPPFEADLLCFARTSEENLYQTKTMCTYSRIFNPQSDTGELSCLIRAGNQH